MDPSSHTLTDLSVMATAHHMAADYYRSLSHGVKFPMAMAQTLILFTSTLSTVVSDQIYITYINQGLSLVSLVCVGIDGYFAWSRLSQQHDDVAAQYFELRDHLLKVRNSDLSPSEKGKKSEDIENEFLTLLAKNKRPSQRFQKKALLCLKENMGLINAIERRRSESRENKVAVIHVEPKQ